MSNFRERLIAAAPTSTQFGFQGLRAADSVAIEECLPLSFIIACDWGLDGAKWNSHLRYFSVERTLGKRIVWTHRSIVAACAGAWGDELKSYLTSDGVPRTIVPYRSTEFLEQMASETNGRISILANPLGLKTRLDDKTAFRREAERSGIAVPPGEIVAIGEISGVLIEKWGPKIIVSERVGSSGNQTYLIEGPDILYSLKSRLIEKSGADAPVIVSSFLTGPAIGAAAVIFQGRPRMSYPSAMITGLAGSSMHRFDYAGSDYGAYTRLSSSVQKKIRESTLRFGEWVAGMGYKGLFGVDFIIHGGEPYVLEVNPRLLGTTQLMTELELRHNLCPPSIYWHLADLLDVGQEEDEGLAQLGEAPLEGFQLLLRNTQPYPVRIGHATAPGIYFLDGASPRFIRDGDRLSDLQGPEEILVTCSPPATGTDVEPRGALFKLEGLGSLLDEAAENVTPLTARIVQSFTDSLNLTAVP